MSTLFIRAALVGCVASGAAVAQTPPPTPYSVPLTGTTLQMRVTPPAPAKMVLKSFDVADLVCPPADSPLAKPGTDPAMMAAAKAFADVRGEELLQAVRAATDGMTWDQFGGVGKLALTTDGKALVVSNTAAEVEKVGACVESLRRLRSAQVKVDMVVFTVPSKNEAMAKLFGDKGHAAVSPDEMNKMLRELKASGAVDILTRPTLILTNKQTGFCQVGQQVPLATAGGAVTCSPVGITTRMTPDVSTDLKSVALAFEFDHSVCTGGPLPAVDCQRVETKLLLSDGGTMAVKVGTRKVEQKTEMKVPVVGDMPYLGPMFRTVGVSREPVDTVAVITATRVLEAPASVRPPVVVPPPLMTATKATPVAVSPVAATAVYPHPVPVIRTVAQPVVERVGVDFIKPPSPEAMPNAVTGVRMSAPPGITLVRCPADVACVAGGVIGTTMTGTCGTDETATLMGAYKAACAAGKKDEAAKLALQLLAKDPTCFGKK